VLEYELHIFNRWGMEVFSSTDPEDVWVGGLGDGEFFIQNEVYNYSLRIKGHNSETHRKEGTILMMR
jgi:hypothetical protein